MLDDNTSILLTEVAIWRGRQIEIGVARNSTKIMYFLDPAHV